LFKYLKCHIQCRRRHGLNRSIPDRFINPGANNELA
jgi:hypothetical protein